MVGHSAQLQHSRWSQHCLSPGHYGQVISTYSLVVGHFRQVNQNLQRTRTYSLVVGHFWQVNQNLQHTRTYSLVVGHFWQVNQNLQRSRAWHFWQVNQNLQPSTAWHFRQENQNLQRSRAWYCGGEHPSSAVCPSVWKPSVQHPPCLTGRPHWNKQS